VEKDDTFARAYGKDVEEARTSHVGWNEHGTKPTKLGHVRWRKRWPRWTAEAVGSGDLACMVRRETKRSEATRRDGWS